MTINEFVELFAEQFDETDANEFTPETKFREFDEWSSLEALCILSMASDEFGVQITNAELKSAETVEDVYKLILSKKD